MSSSILTSALTSLLHASPSLSHAVPRAFSAVTAGGSFTLPSLAYDYGALEPAISGDIMRIHHTKHHNAYVTNLNIALEKYSKASAAGNIAEMIALQPALRFNGGGHVNHSIFWENLAPAGKGGGGEPSGDLAKLITERFGSFAALKAAMNAAGAGVQGSGWVWLGFNKATGKVEVAACANQDPLSTVGLVPLIGIDVWEHACAWRRARARARARAAAAARALVLLAAAAGASGKGVGAVAAAAAAAARGEAVAPPRPRGPRAARAARAQPAGQQPARGRH